jgi:hypothetical protein
VQPFLTSVAKSEADTTLGEREFAWSFGDVVRFNGKGEKQIGKAGHLEQTLPFVEGNEHLIGSHAMSASLSLAC